VIVSEEQYESLRGVRSAFYKSMLGIDYLWMPEIKRDPKTGAVINTSTSSQPQYSGDPLPSSRKPYVPPTQFNPESKKPFGDLLDEPLG
jgi:hypothetical protein